MPILTVGLNHRTAPVALRERFALSGEQLAAALAAARAELDEAVVLATCNRTEIYAVGAQVEAGLRALEGVLAARAAPRDGAELALRPHCYAYVGADAVRQLLRVAAGLDSLILGEPQILGQVRSALAAAEAAGTTGPVLARLLRTALAAGKEARTVTGIARHATSISHAAVALARAEYGTLHGRAVLLIGAGKMAELAADTIAAATRGNGAPGSASITIVNRTPERAVALATRLGGTARPLTHLADALRVCDVAITSTGAPAPLITPDLLAPLLAARARRPLLLIDIAVPRDVDPAVGALPGVTLRNIDDLQDTVSAGLAARAGEIEKVEAVLDRHAAGFWAWLQARDVAPTIAALRAKAEAIRAVELARALDRLSHLDERDRNAVAALSVALANKLLHEPTVRLKRAHDGRQLADAASVLFDLPQS